MVMKSFMTVATTALVGYTVAGPHNGHQVYHNKLRGFGELKDNTTCGCTTYYTTFIGAGTCKLQFKRMFYGGCLTDRRTTVVQDIQPNMTTVHNTKTKDVQITVVPKAETATFESPAEVTSRVAPAPVSLEPYTRTSSTRLAPASASPKSHTQISSAYVAPAPVSLKSYTQTFSIHPVPAPAEVETSHPSPPASLPEVSGSAELPVHAPSTPVLQPKEHHQPVQPAPAPDSKAPSQPVVQTPAPKPKAPSSSPDHSSTLVTSGNQWCMTYSPYTSSGGCKSSSAVSADIASIASKGFSSVRLYSTDCSGLPNVGTAAAAHGLKLVLGVFISETGISEAESQIEEITSWANGNYDNVEMVVIGNEAVFNSYCTASALAEFLASAKSTLKAAGYIGPVTTTEPLNILQEYAETLCPAMDVASANIHPFFNADISASNAGSFVAKELRVLETVCPGKEAYNLETGWPNQGLSNGAACPGAAEQKEAIEGIKAAAGGKSVFFSFEDDLWKGEGELGVERSWGCAHLFEDN